MEERVLRFDQALAVIEGLPQACAVCFDPHEHQTDGGRVAQLVVLKLGNEQVGGCSYALSGTEWASFRRFKRILKQREYKPGLVVRWLEL